jgi:flotillin
MPEIAKNVAQPLSKVDKITMYGEGNNTKLIQDIVNGTTQVTEGVASGLGIDLKALISGFLGGKVSQTGEDNRYNHMSKDEIEQAIEGNTAIDIEAAISKDES